MMKREQKGNRSVRVLLVDESSVALQAVKAALAAQYQMMVVGTACSADDAHAAIRAWQPHVVVLEVVIGGASGISLCQTIRASHPHVGVLFFTAVDDAHLLRAAIAAGAQGYLLKAASCEALLKSIEAVAIGRAVIDPGLTSQVLSWIRERKRVAPRWSRADSSDKDLKFHSYVSS